MQEERKHRSVHTGRTIIVILVLLLFVAAGTAGLLFVKYKQIADIKPGSERQRIIAKLQPVIELPNEQPNLSTVLDTTKLTNPTLKQRARNGDVLIIYKSAKRLIIYRPSSDKVVDMLTIQKQSDGSSE